MAETIIESVLSGELEVQQVVSWLREGAQKGAAEPRELRGCSRDEFVLYFLSYLRSQTDSITQQASSVGAPPPSPAPAPCGRPHRRSVSDPTPAPATPAPPAAPAAGAVQGSGAGDTLQVAADTRAHDSPARDRKRGTRKVKTKLFPDDRSRESIQSVSSDESRLSSGVGRLLSGASTPQRGVSGVTGVSPPRACSTPRDTGVIGPMVTPTSSRCDTPRTRHTRHESTLADYLVSAQKSSKKKKSKNSSEGNESKELDISSSDAFPDLSSSSRKSNSLRSERRRIKPTNIDLSKKSLSLNSFSDSFQQPSPLALEDNALFKSSTGVQSKASTGSYDAERALLKQERSRLMEKFSSMNLSPKCHTPLIKITQNTFEKPTNFVSADASKVTFKDKIDLLVEIYETMLTYNLIYCYNAELFFLITILQSKQLEDDYIDVESKLTEENIPNYLLKSIHNCTYFSVRSLFQQRSVLEVILDKQSLKLLGEVKSVRSFGQDLAKCLLNCYGVRCEGDRHSEPGDHGGVVAYNLETDNADNFPSNASFQCFKKQRDMFYDIVRWYQSPSPAAGAPGLRPRVRSLLSAGAGHAPATHVHLASLWARHLSAAVWGRAGGATRMTKLARRLTRPQNVELFADEDFYREFLVSCESESFRTHVRDALIAELIAIDTAHHHKEGSPSSLTRSGLVTRALGKLLGLLCALPYTERGSHGPVRGHTTNDRLVRNSVALRGHTQPPFDLQGIIQSSYEQSRLIITIPWVCHFLYALDPVALRLPYYSRVLGTLAAIYRGLACPGDSAATGDSRDGDSVTRTYLKVFLAWLFQAPHVPQESLYESPLPPLPPPLLPPPPPAAFDSLPPRKSLLELVSAGAAVGGASGGVRHVTPLRVGAATPRHDMQARLEHQLLSSQPASSRRVLELAAERVLSRAARDLARATQPHRGGTTHVCTPQSLAPIRAVGVAARDSLRTALGALLPLGAPLGALSAAAERGVRGRLARHPPGELCPPALSELQALLSEPWTTGGEVTTTQPPTVTTVHSVAESIIDLKEQVCLLLSSQPAPTLPAVVSSCAASCCASNPACRGPARRAVLQLTLDLCVAVACKTPSSLTEQFLDSLEPVWNACCPASGPGCSPGPATEMDRDEQGEYGPAGPLSPSVITSDKGTPEDSASTFGRVVCPRNIALLSRSGAGSASWHAMSLLLTSLLRRGRLTDSVLAERCVALYRQEWPQEVLSPLSTCLSSLSPPGGSVQLLLGFLADYCEDLDH